MNTTEILNRLDQLVDFLIDAHPYGVTTQEIGDYFNVTRQTAMNDIKRLGARGELVYQPSTHTYAIDPHGRIPPLRLTLAQAWMLYLPLRRTVRAQMQRYPLVQNLLQRLAVALESEIGEALVPEATDETTSDDVLVSLFEAWRDHHLVEIRYQPLGKPESRHVIAPHWFEPAVWSDSAYVIAGIQSYRGEFTIATLKLDRILTASVRPQQFDRIEAALLLQSLQETWGIWLGEEPITVKLRFHNRVRQRLLETRWHPTEQIIDEEDGSVIWQGLIAEPQEMLPWIRSWGADVEVLEPKTIRDAIAIGADRTARLYGLCEDTGDDYF